MTITSPKLDTTHLTANEAALLRCQTALELKDKEDYEGAQEAMRPLWKGLGERPDISGLYSSVAAEVVLCVGILTGWIGSKKEIEQAQEQAKNLISESIALYESLGDVNKMAAARAEIANCYWREGAFNEARIMFIEALQKLTTEGNTRARALLRLAIVECSSSKYTDALRILTENSSLFEKISNHAIIGAYHNQLAMVLRTLATSENRNDYFRRAVSEYQKADEHFKVARNLIFRANVKNNIGYLLGKLSKFAEAHRYIKDALRLSIIVRDKIQTAQINDTRAQILIAEGGFAQAESVARSAVSVLEKSGQQCLLTDALITHGTALARLGENERAQSVFERAIEFAHQVGALNKAGLAGLTMIEELDDLPPVVLFGTYERAADWLSGSQSLDTLLRLNDAARKIFMRLHAELAPEDPTDVAFNPKELPQAMLNYERTLIRQALAKTNGSVTRAASLLGISYQGLAYTIEAKHKDLLRERTPIRRRSRKDPKGQ